MRYEIDSRGRRRLLWAVCSAITIISIFGIVDAITTDDFGLWTLGLLALGLACVIASLVKVHLSVYLMLHDDHLDVSRFVLWRRYTQKRRVPYERVLSVTTYDSGEVDIAYGTGKQTGNPKNDLDSVQFTPDSPLVVSEIKRRVQLAVTVATERR
jgi:hypothetical protein